MIERKTTFVVGAGASKELGLPLGEKLKSEIVPLIDIRFDDWNNIESGDLSVVAALDEFCRTEPELSLNHMLRKCWLLRDALPAAISIDNLLDAHRDDPHVAFVGKVAIAKAILAAERSSDLFWDNRHERTFKLEKASGSWLIPLFQKLTENVPKADANTIFDNVSFIVFNYDRCLEYFLPKALSAYYGLSDPEVREIVGKAKIYHPYGQVGGFERGDSEGVAGFGQTDIDLAKAANRIRTFTEGLRYESHREEIQQAVVSTENLVFLGFAFHPLNMEIVKVADSNSIRKVFGTTIGLADAAVRRIREDIFLAINKRPDDGKAAAADYLDEINLENRGASDFLYAHFRSLE